MWIRALLCLWLMMSGLPVSAEQAMAADHINGSDSIKVDYAYWYSDERIELSNVLELKTEQWTQVESLKNHGFKSGEYWIHLDVSQSSLSSDSHYFRFLHAVHDVVDIFVLSKDGDPLHEWHLGDTVKNIQRPVQEKKPSFKLIFDQQTQMDVYIRVSGINALLLTMEVMTEAEREKTVQIEVLIAGLVYGILLVMMLYNFGLAVSIRDKAYYFYVTYVGCYILFLLCLTGDGMYYLWPDNVDFNTIAMPVFAGVLIVPSLLFPYYLLDLRLHAPHLIPYFKLLLIIALAYLLLIPVLGLAVSLIIINVFSIIASVFMLGVGVYLSIKRVPIALIYTFSWFFLLLGLAVLPMSSLGYIESTVFTRFSNMFGGVIESILLSLALAQRIRLERNERLHAIKQAIVLKDEIAENRKMFQELFDYAPIGMFRFTTEGELVAVNNFLAELLGFSRPQEVLDIGPDIRKLFDNGYDLASRALNHESILDEESVLTMSDNSQRTCSVTLRTHSQNNMEVIEGFITDISERKQAQRIHEIMEKERMTTMEQLVTGVAHEINTPLGNNVTSVSHLTELLAEVDKKMMDGSLNKSFFNGFIEDSQSLMTLMSSNLNKITSLIQRFKLVSVNHIDIEKAQVVFKEQVEYSVDYFFFQKEGSETNKDINVKVDTHGYVSIHSYPAVWRIILDQLFENSIIHGFQKNQKDKKIKVDLNFENDEWVVSYEDNGKGMSAEMKGRIFDPFVTSKRGNADNAGLGMYRVYNLVSQVLKGKINIEESNGFKVVIRFK